MDVAPYISNGSIFISSQYLSQALGASETSVNTDAAAGTVTLIKGNKTVQVKVGSSTMLVNNLNVTMDAAPEVKEGRIMVPLSPVAQAFGAATTWDSASNSITVGI